MTDIFISYARSTEAEARRIEEALRSLGHGVWRDDQLPAHRAYTEVLEERLKAAKAVMVIWSAEAVRSVWVQSEADRARADRKLVRLTVDGSALPMPFDRIQYADLAGWMGDIDAAGWRKVVASISDLLGRANPAPIPGSVADAPLPLPTKPSIAILPFANLSGDPEQEYFADGMVEEIARALSLFKSIFVIGGGSSLAFKGKGSTPREAAEILGVRYVLEGSVRKAGGRVRIAVKLIDATDGAQLWAERFEDTLEDVFALQDKVALGVANVIGAAVQEAEIRRASSRPTENPTSYDFHLRAVSLHRTASKADVLAALDLAKRAIALDPDYGSALALAVNCEILVVVYGWSDDLAGHLSDGEALAQRAIKVAGDDPEVLATVATSLPVLGGSVQAAAALSDRAVALNPGSSVVWYAAGVTRLHSGEPRLAVEHFETSLRLDPLSPWRPFLLGFLGAALFAGGRFAEAVSSLGQSAQLRPEWPMSWAFLASSHGHLGATREAREALARHRALTPADIRDWISVRPAGLRKLIDDGITLAEGKAPSEAGGGR